MSASLDMLCDMLEAELSDTEEIHNPVLAPPANEAENAAADSSTSTCDEPLELSTEAAPTDPTEGVPENPNNDEVLALQAQMKAMQEQMVKMQELLNAKKSMDQTPVQEIDMFAAGSSRAPAAQSPVKTNPFAECDKPRKAMKLYQKTPKFGPAVQAKTSRVLQGEEKVSILERLGLSDREKLQATMVRDDLADSSDEEAERNPMESKYTDYGLDIKKRLARQSSSSHEVPTPANQPLGFNKVQGATLNLTHSSKNKVLPQAMIVEKNSRLRISNPQMSQSALDVQFLGKTFIPIYRMKDGAVKNEMKGEWSTVGVIFYKKIQTSKNGNPYTMWQLTDLFGQVKTVKVMLFGRTHNRHYKIQMNRVVAMHNAKLLDDNSGRNEITLAVDNPEHLVELGDSVDAGKCQATKNDGSGCTNLVNLASCEFCEFHVKRAYKSMSSKRGDLQSSFSGNGDVRSRLMGKVDPKGEIFGGGKFMNAVSKVGKASVQQRTKDHAALRSLGVTPADRVSQDRKPDPIFSKSQLKGRTDLSQDEKTAILGVARGVSSELGMKLLAPTPGARSLIKHLTQETLTRDMTADEKKLELLNKGQKRSTAKSATELLNEHKNELAENRRQQVLKELKPQLGRGMSQDDMVDLSIGGAKPLDLKKTRALLTLKSKGVALAKSNPNHTPTRKRKAEEKLKSKAKVLKALDESGEPSKSGKNREDPPPKVMSNGEILTQERLAKIRSRKSRNQNLIEDHENEVLDKHLDSLERVERMEEKMINTKEIETKAVACKICNYTAFSQSELCKKSGHRIKVITCMKRFFECKDCKHRTIALDKYPKSSCSKCGGSQWSRTGMMKEKKGPILDSERLCIRGGEQKFINQTLQKSDLNLDM
eukprot:maker-scaffold426_size175065-snap-gene-0.37 protein:Tk08645 transcript:maker-scaffold426_size175065-snap-gene-0.37-mRNA-1 annotation:"hypothetical protein DAPPUDRAFT_300822"